MRLGLLYPGYAAEDDLPWLVDALFADGSVVADVVHTSVGEDAHRVDALLDLGGRERLREGAATLREHGAEVAVWACTSGSFVFGWDGARRQVEELAADVRRPGVEHVARLRRGAARARPARGSRWPRPTPSR